MKSLYLATAILCLVLLIGFCIWCYYAGYCYDRDIGSYLDNACDMVEPTAMKEEMLKIKQAMIDHQLNSEDYGVLIFKKPDNKMDFQYKHLDTIIDRCNAVEQWRDDLKKKGNIENMGDVYEIKMQNLRVYIMKTNGRSDWIAEDVYKIKYYLFSYKFISTPIIIILVLLIVLFGVLFIKKLDDI